MCARAVSCRSYPANVIYRRSSKLGSDLSDVLNFYKIIAIPYINQESLSSTKYLPVIITRPDMCRMFEKRILLVLYFFWFRPKFLFFNIIYIPGIFFCLGRTSSSSASFFFSFFFLTGKVLVSEVDEKQQARERERARLDDEGRLAEQLRHAEALGAVKRGQVSTGERHRTALCIFSSNFLPSFALLIRSTTFGPCCGRGCTFELKTFPADGAPQLSKHPRVTLDPMFISRCTVVLVRYLASPMGSCILQLSAFRAIFLVG